MSVSFRSLSIMASIFTAVNIAASATEIEHIHPLNWWSGMQDSRLQIMLHGKDIAQSKVSLKDSKGVKLVKIQRVENPNYLFLYVDLAKAPAQTFQIHLNQEGDAKGTDIPYQLLQRGEYRPNPFGPQDVLYLLMPDRFVNGNHELDSIPGLAEPTVSRYHKTKNPGDYGRHGGDLQGIRQSLDYLQDLGITALWPTPVQFNDAPGSYHGYAITDYYQIDPHLGSNEEYRSLVDDCHKHGIKMVMDLVFNHMGSNNFLYRDLPQKDWFNFDTHYVQSVYRTNAISDIHASKYDRLMTTDGWFVESMPDINQRNPLVKDYLIQSSLWWIEYAGVDGFRQDTYPYADQEMMAEWNLRLEREYPGFNVVGETWVNNAAGVAYWQKDSKLSSFNSQLKTVMDFPLMGILNSALDEESDDWSSGLSRIYDHLTADLIYADPNHLLTFLGNHDTDRFAPNWQKAKQFWRYKQALALLLTLRGIPQLYYGDECGAYGNRSHGDGRFRQDMVFPEAPSTKSQIDPLEYHAYTRQLLNWRKKCQTVQTGALTQFAVYQGCYVYSRHLDGKRVTVILNGTSQEVELSMERYMEVIPALKAMDITSLSMVTIGETLHLEPRQVMILEF